MSRKPHQARRKISLKKSARRRAESTRRKRRVADKQAGERLRRVDTALKRYETACHTAVARGEDLASLAGLISEVAIEKHSARIVSDWCERQLLRDVIDLRDALAEHAPASLNPRLEALRLLPDALMQWLEMRFSVVPTGTVGEVLEIPVAKLRNYLCTFEVPTDSTSLIRICVVAVGWKRGKALLIPPSVRLADQSEQSSPPEHGLQS